MQLGELLKASKRSSAHRFSMFSLITYKSDIFFSNNKKAVEKRKRQKKPITGAVREKDVEAHHGHFKRKSSVTKDQQKGTTREGQSGR